MLSAHAQFHELLIKVSISLLGGGNCNVQESFLELLKTNTMPMADIAARMKAVQQEIRAESTRARSTGAGDVLTDAEKIEAWVPAVRLLKFLQVLCEGHNWNLQNFLRDQDSTRRAVNLVAETCMLLHTLHDKITRPMDDLATQVRPLLWPMFYGAQPHLLVVQALDTLIEMVQGPCAQNQLALVNNKFVESVGALLSTASSKKGGDSRASSEVGGVFVSRVVQYKCMIAIVALFEGKPDKVVHTRVSSLLPFKTMQNNLTAIFADVMRINGGKYTDDAFLQPLCGKVIDTEVCEQRVGGRFNFLQTVTSQEREEGTVIEMGFAIFILFKVMLDFNGDLRGHIEPQGEVEEWTATSFINIRVTYESAWSFFSNYTKSVEIVRDDKLERFYFPLPPMCTFLSQRTMEHYKWSIDRSSPSKKIQEFIACVPPLAASCARYRYACDRVAVQSPGQYILGHDASIKTGQRTAKVAATDCCLRLRRAQLEDTVLLPRCSDQRAHSRLLRGFVGPLRRE